MSGLLGPDGNPISSEFENAKASAPITGNAFGAWAGRDITYATLPGGGVVQFDLNQLRVSDFRNMRDHYQVNSSLAVLSFMLHQSDYTVQCEDKRIADFCQKQIDDIWTILNRALSQANWAGYSPNILNWENNIPKRSVDLTLIKDLIPEECRVNWKLIDGWAPPGRIPPKYKEYDGIIQYGWSWDGNFTQRPANQPTGWPYPAENTLWYSLLMENGDYYGKKLLRPAFVPWFFSLLVHLFANRYYERFGEPVPVGRAPFDEDLDVGGEKPIRGSDYMLQILQNLRSRQVIVLPNERTDTGTAGAHPTFDYDIEYLESQMRGADFERYLTRLDEEISLGLFTPILLMRTADVGSYNLGVGHTQMYLWMLNAMNDDRAYYINNYILSPMVDFNFSPNSPRAKIKFNKLGNITGELLQSIIVALIQNQRAIPDLDQLGQMAGMDLKAIRQTLKPQQGSGAPTGDGATTGDGGDTGTSSGDNYAGVLRETMAIKREIVNRVTKQVDKAFRDHTFGNDMEISLGYRRRMEKMLAYDGVSNPVESANEFYARVDSWCKDVVALGEAEFSGPTAFMSMLDRVLDAEFERIERAQA